MPIGSGQAISAMKADGGKFCSKLTCEFFDAVEKLVKLPKSAPKREKTKVMRAAQLLLDNPLVDINWVDPTAPDMTVLMFFIAEGHCNHPFVRMLLASDRIEVNTKAEDGNIALHYASCSSNLVFLRELLQDQRFDIHAVNKGGKTILDVAAITGTEFIIAAIFTCKTATSNQNFLTPICTPSMSLLVMSSSFSFCHLIGISKSCCFGRVVVVFV